jgi:DMSO/TMAO reductase YedYZ heme-binding membrane subunit
MTSQFWWYVARSAGVVAWGLATASVVWGLMLSSRVLGRRVTLPKLLDLHRFLGGLSVVFVLVHMLGLLLDNTVDFGLSALLVPMASKWEPGAVAWGVVAFYLLIAVEVTSLLRGSIRESLWRKVHYGGFAVFLFGTIHGLKTGTDVENPLIWWPAAIGAAGVVGLCAYRIFAGEEMRIAPRTERVPAALLEKTLTELERFDTEAYPAPAPSPTAAPIPLSPTFEPLSEFSFRAPAAEPEPMFPDLAPPRPPAEREVPSIWTPPAVPADPARDVPSIWTPPAVPADPARDVPSIWTPPAVPADPAPPSAPPVPSRSTVSETLLARSLPTRTPQRLDTTTAPAALGVWTPATRPVHEDASGPPAPPEAIDPTTGDPDPQAYRRWLREWLSYVESQP